MLARGYGRVWYWLSWWLKLFPVLKLYSCHTCLFPNRFLPDAAKRKAKVNPAAAEMYSGWWTKRKTTGEPIGTRMNVLIKPVGFLSEREV